MIIDEAQHLTKVLNARRLQDQMDTVKSLASAVGVQFILVGTYELLPLLNQNGQLARRTRPIHFPRYRFENAKDRQSFGNILGMFESRLPIKAGGVLVQNLEYHFEHCLGCVGTLKDRIKLACRNAIESGRDHLQLQDFESIALGNDSLLQMLQEILEGERRMEARTERGDELRTKLGLQKSESSETEKSDKKDSKQAGSRAQARSRPCWRGHMLKESPNQMDDGWQRIPARSQLYCLEPIEKGTDLVESATSYLSRVANAHTVSTWMLLKHEIAPRLFGPDAVIRNRLSELTATMGAACNGENATASKLVSILQTLTGRDDLVRTTMGFCRGFVASRFLVRVEQAWCSTCLNEWKKEGREIYLPLLWHVLAVRVCPRHGTKLNTKCHACRRSFHPLMAHSRPGFCHRCGEWLGTGSEEVGHPESVAHSRL